MTANVVAFGILVISVFLVLSYSIGIAIAIKFEKGDPDYTDNPLVCLGISAAITAFLMYALSPVYIGIIKYVSSL